MSRSNNFAVRYKSSSTKTIGIRVDIIDVNGNCPRKHALKLNMQIADDSKLLSLCVFTDLVPSTTDINFMSA